MTSHVVQRRTPLHVTWRWLALVAVPMMASSVGADSRTRHYDFEEGTANATTNTVADKFDTPPHLAPAFGTFFNFDHVVPGTNNPVVAGEPLKTWIDTNVDPTPALTLAPAATTGGTFVANTSPAPGSTIALQFNGTDQALQGPAFRDSYVDQTAYNTNAPAVLSGTGSNLATTFFQLSQAWVRPSSAGNGTEQVVWAVGEENGGIRITADGKWQITAVGGAVINNPSPRPVAFDQWTHVAISRGGGGATLRINGSIAGTATGSFGKWGDFLTLGGNEDLSLLFNGAIDNFDVGGNYDGSFVPFTDLTFFSDLMIPQPTNVPGDVDQDGDADQTDYQIWSTNAGFNNGFGVGDVTTLIKGDVNADGRIDFFDFTVIAGAAAAVGTALDLSGSSVPEPSAFVLASMAALAFLVRRRK